MKNDYSFDSENVHWTGSGVVNDSLSCPYFRVRQTGVSSETKGERYYLHFS